MIQAGTLTKVLAEAGTVPHPGRLPPLEIRDTPDEAIRADRRLAGETAREAWAAAQTDHPLAEVCAGMERLATRWASRQAGEPFPLEAGASRTFASFERTLDKLIVQRRARPGRSGAESR